MRTFLPAVALLVGCPQQTVAPVTDDLTVAILSHRDGDVVTEGVPVTFRGLAQATATPPSQIRVAWYAGDVAQCLDTPDADGLTECTLAMPAGQDTVRLRAQLPNGDEQRAEVVLEVRPGIQAPQVTITAPSAADRYLAGTPILFEGTVTDADDPGADLQIAWESALTGPLPIAATPDANGRVAGAAALTAGVHLVTLSAVDPDGNLGTDSVLVTVNPDGDGNSLPTAPEVAIAPSSPSPGEALSAAIVSPSTDADGDPVTYGWAWFRDGVPQAAYTGADVPTGVTGDGETWRVVVTPFDGVGYGPAGSDEVFVARPDTGIDPDTDLGTDTDAGTDPDTDPPPFDHGTCAGAPAFERIPHAAGNRDFRRVVYAPDGSHALLLQEGASLWRFDPADDTLTLVAEASDEIWNDVAFDASGAFALIGGSTDTATPAPRLKRYVDGVGLEDVPIPPLSEGGLVGTSRITALDQRPTDGVWAVLSDSYGDPTNILYMNELTIGPADGGDWIYGGGVNTGTSRMWAPDSVGWVRNLGGWVVLTSSAQGSTHVYDPLLSTGRWTTATHPGAGNLGEVMVDRGAREKAWVLNGFTARVNAWEGLQFYGGTASVDTGNGSLWRMDQSPDGAWKVLVGGAGLVVFSDSPWRPLDAGRFYRTPVSNFGDPPWSGGNGDGFTDVAWRPGTCSGLIVGTSTANQGLLVGWWLR